MKTITVRIPALAEATMLQKLQKIVKQFRNLVSLALGLSREAHGKKGEKWQAIKGVATNPLGIISFVMVWCLRQSQDGPHWRLPQHTYVLNSPDTGPFLPAVSSVRISEIFGVTHSNFS